MDRQVTIYLPSGQAITVRTTDPGALALENYLMKYTDVPRVDSDWVGDTAERFLDKDGDVWEVPTDMLRCEQTGRIMISDEVEGVWGPLTLITNTNQKQEN